MCTHRLIVYTICGHSTFSTEPLILCRNASIAPDSDHSSHCELSAHPFKSHKLEQLCPHCHNRRTSMLGRLEACQQVTFDEFRWKVSYAMPAHGKDYWTTKMEEKAKETQEARDKALKERREEKGKAKRFSSWRRKSKGGSLLSARTND